MINHHLCAINENDYKNGNSDDNHAINDNKKKNSNSNSDSDIMNHLRLIH